MKKVFFWLTLTAICLISISAVPQSKPQQWEYKFEYDIKEKKANDLGGDGWELVATGSTGTGNSTTFVFKRPKN